jgi:hypothetical protein
MSDKKPEAPNPEIPTAKNSDPGQVAGIGNPTHIAIDIAVWKAVLDVLGTLPFSQVEQLIPAIRGGQPMNLGTEE